MVANTRNSNLFKNNGELLKDTEQGNPTEGQTFRHYDQEVDSFFEPDLTPTFGIMAVKVTNERNRNRARVSYDSLDTDDLYSWVTKQNPQELGGLNWTITKTWVDATAGPPEPDANSLTQLYSVVKPYDRAHSTKETATVSAWQVFTDEEEEPETGEEVLVERKIILPATMTETKGESRKVKTVKILDEKKALVVTRTIDIAILSTTYTEYHNVKYYFPSYMDATNPMSIIDIGNFRVAASVNKSSDHEFTIPCRFATTYHTSAITPSEIFQFKAVDVNLSYPAISANNVLTDEGVVQFSWVSSVDASTGDDQYSNMSYGISASSPTTTEYLALMGTEVLIIDEVVRWKYNLWKRTKVYLTIPDLSLGLDGYLSY
tara:strand:- start:2359 stop:3483 length:1125 start_codon:yes stop_codon:yes gene_type:complete